MPRMTRMESEASIYHVIARGASHQIIFENDEDRAFFMQRVTAELDKGGGSLMAWCLMDNHFHLLVKIPIKDLSDAMRVVLSEYAGYFNRAHGRSGHLFEGRFKSEPVNSNEYLMTVVRYIHNNPLKAGLAKDSKYAWSSYSEYVSGGGWAQTRFVLDVFGGRDEFVRFHEKDSGDDLCLEVDEHPRVKVADAFALQIADDVLGTGGAGRLKSAPRGRRDAGVRSLRDHGLSVRQIQRLTGLSLGTISRVGK